MDSYSASFEVLSKRHDLGPAVKSLLRESWDVSSLALTPEALAAQDDDGRCDAVVAVLGDGRVAAHACVERAGSDACVSFVCVTQCVRKRGLGRILMAHVERHARSLGCTRLTLECEDRGVQTFYEKCGYGIAPNESGDRATVAMEKRLV